MNEHSNPLYYNLELTQEILKNIDLISVCFFAASISLIVYVFRNNRANIYRPAFILATLCFIFYQIPMTLFSGMMKSSLPNYSSFAFTIQLSVLFGIIWTLFTPKLSAQPIDVSSNKNKINIELKLPTWIFIISVCIGFALVYLHYVPFQCTGLFAAFFDPEMTVWASIYSTGFSGSTLASISYGILANVIVPIIFVLIFFQIRKNLSYGKLIKSLVLMIPALFLLLLVLLPSIKHMLLPTMITTLVVLFCASRNYFSMFFSILISMTIIFFSLSIIDVSKKRPVTSSHVIYDAGFCAVNGNVCNESILLVDSLDLNFQSLGLSNNRRNLIKQQVNNSCLNKSVKSGGAENDSLLDTNVTSTNNIFVPFKNANKEFSKDTIMIVLLKSINEYLGPKLYGTFVFPLQVASWHYLYAVEYNTPGLSILPFSKLFTDHSADVERKVYQAYGSKYFHGDKTYNSKASTGYIFLYSAYLGVAGMLIAWAYIILFDVSASFLFCKFDGANRYIFLGIIYVSCLHMLISDAVTVIFLRGLGGGYILCFLINWIEKLHLNRRNNKEILVSSY